MKLQRIEHFIEVADAGSIRGAARRLAMSQPALTRSLQQLEEELGVQLMRRGVHGASLTAAGSAFLARARVANAELGKAAEEARRTVDQVGGLLTLAVSPVPMSLLMPELFATLQAQAPALRLRLMELTPSALLAMVREGDAELAVTQRTRANLDAGLKYRPLLDIQLRVAARPGHPLAKARQLQDLVGAGWLAQTAPGIVDDITSQSFLAAGMAAPVPVMHWSAYSAAVIDTVAATDLLITLPPPLMRSVAASGKLVEIPLAKPLVPLRLGLYSRADSPPMPAAKAATQVIVGIARRFAAAAKADR